MEHESGDYDKRRLKLLAIAAEFIVFYCVLYLVWNLFETFWFTLMLSPTNSPFFKPDPHAVIPNKLAFPSLHCSISSYTLKTVIS